LAGLVNEEVEREAPVVRAAIVAVGILVAQQVAGKATRDALFLSHFDVTALPLAAGSAAIVSFGAVLAFARGMVLLTPSRVVPLAVGVSSVLLIGEWGLSLVLPRPAAVAVYFHMSAFGGTLLSGFWSLVNERLNPHSAKRVVGRIGMGSSVGGLLGGLLTWRVATVTTLPTMLLAMAALGLLCLVPLLRIRPLRDGMPEPRAALPVPVLSGLRVIRGDAYLRDLAILVGLSALLEALLDYVFNSAAVASVPTGAPLMSFFALYHSSVALLGVAAQATLIRASLGRLGLATTMGLPSGFVALGSCAAMAFPGLAGSLILRGGQAVLRNSLFRSAYELLYTPLPLDRKRSAKAIVDVACDRLGATLGSGLLALGLLVAPASHLRLPLLAASSAIAVAMVLLARHFHRRYVKALADGLRTSVVHLDPREIVDATTRLTLATIEREKQQRLEKARKEQIAAGPPALPSVIGTVAELGSRDRDRIRGALRRRDSLDRRLVGLVIPLLADDDLFPDAVRALRTAAPNCEGQLVDALLDRELGSVVRRRIPRVLAAMPTQRAADGLMAGLRDDQFAIRFRCTRALVKLKKQNLALLIPAPEVFAAALRELALERQSGRTLDLVFDILSLALERDPLKIALWAFRSGDEGLRGTALEYLENVLPPRVRESLWPRLGGPPRPQPTGRPTDELRDELLRSTASTATRRSVLRSKRGTKG
jgi:hypothetical protein